ncbi:flagellar hook-length control protein FliK [Thiomonas sp. FB-Cd]|uniref:flagellar hook-length control protein FliK n=1 Tax=Thiomonas sp. FB-Cd TaxID=1158292 RepID=UPI0012DEC677|nr:flagellar hook-length control protein FliK [Thiomonas sp. FB-Cd]
MSGIPNPASTLPISPAGGATLDSRAATPSGSQATSLAMPPGTRIMAEVVQTQADGQVLLRLGQTLVAATLPGSYAKGQMLPLIVVAALDNPNSQATVQGTLAPQPKPGTPLTFLLAPASAPVADAIELSPTAQLLGRLQQLTPQPHAMQSARPVWAPSRAGSAGQLASQLAQSIHASGLFYESHLVAWAQGRLPLTALLAEPQAQYSASPSTQPLGSQTQTGAPASGNPAAAEARATPPYTGTGPSQMGQSATGVQTDQALPQLSASPIPVAHAQQALVAYTSLLTLPSPHQANGGDIPASLVGLVQQQLATLAQGSVQWTGQIWAGQQMKWRIEPDDAGHGPLAPTPEACGWTSVLELDLPNLGPLVASVHLGAGGRVRVQLQLSQHEASLHRLRVRGEELGQALRAAGLQMDELTLQSEPAASAP